MEGTIKLREDHFRQKRRAQWINWGKSSAIATVAVGVVTCVAFAMPELSHWQKVSDAPSRIDGLEPRVSALESSNQINGIIIGNKLDKISENVEAQRADLEQIKRFLYSHQIVISVTNYGPLLPPVNVLTGRN